MKQYASQGIEFDYNISTTNQSHTENPSSSLIDNYADTSTEMPDYTGGDD